MQSAVLSARKTDYELAIFGSDNRPSRVKQGKEISPTCIGLSACRGTRLVEPGGVDGKPDPWGSPPPPSSSQKYNVPTGAVGTLYFWWSRGESNPRPKTHSLVFLHA